MNKIELEAENLKLRADLKEVKSELDNYSKTTLKYLAKALGIPTFKKSAYGYNEDTEIFWSDIYVRIGRLRETAEQKSQLERLCHLEDVVNRLSEQGTEPCNEN